MPYHFIAHRGNVNGPIPERENDPAYIQEAINLGYEVEIDVWMVNDALFLGHDEAKYQIKTDFLMEHKDKLWCHAKNEDALFYLIKNRDYFHTFSHDQDSHVLTSRGLIWAYVGKPIDKNTICVMPEQASTPYSDQDLKDSYGICSDFVQMYREIYG
jgi:hypothetical protein